MYSADLEDGKRVRVNVTTRPELRRMAKTTGSAAGFFERSADTCLAIRKLIKECRGRKMTRGEAWKMIVERLEDWEHETPTGESLVELAALARDPDPKPGRPTRKRVS